MSESPRPTSQNTEPTSEQLEEIDKLIDQGVGNRLEAEMRVLGRTVLGSETDEQSISTENEVAQIQPRKPRTSREKAWRDMGESAQRKPPPYGTKPEE